MQVTALQQRPALAAQQQVQQPQWSGARSAVPPRPLADSASSSLGSSLARSTGSRSSSSAATRLAPVRARRERDPILAPMIQQDGPNGEEAVDLYGYLMRNRIIFVNQRIGDDVACRVVASLLALDSLDDQEEIKLYINCAQARLTACVVICNCYALALRGSPYAVVSILDTIRAISAPVSTVAFGIVGGTATTVLAAGAKGRRFSMQNTRILLQQPMGGLQGSADECNITATELNRNMKIMYRFLSEFTGLPEETVEMECDRDNFLGPEQAIALGLIDGVIA
ncbi:ATP-dependent Clp protease proteolytic subunit [Chlorella vulgaris]